LPQKKKLQGVAVGMTSKGKKAYVKLRAGDSIELVES